MAVSYSVCQPFLHHVVKAYPLFVGPRHYSRPCLNHPSPVSHCLLTMSPWGVGWGGGLHRASFVLLHFDSAKRSYTKGRVCEPPDSVTYIGLPIISRTMPRVLIRDISHDFWWYYVLPAHLTELRPNYCNATSQVRLRSKERAGTWTTIRRI